MCWTQKFSFSRDPVILDLKLQLAEFFLHIFNLHQKLRILTKFRKNRRMHKTRLGAPYKIGNLYSSNNNTIKIFFY
jgi:hypothetical protein